MIDTRYKLFRSQIEMFGNAISREDNWIFLNPSERTEKWNIRNETKKISYGIGVPSQSSLGRCIDMGVENGRDGQSATYTAFGLVLDTIAENIGGFFEDPWSKFCREEIHMATSLLFGQVFQGQISIY